MGRSGFVLAVTATVLALACAGQRLPAASEPGAHTHSTEAEGSYPPHSCGVSSLYVLLKLMGRDVTLGDIQERMQLEDEGQVSVAVMMKTAVQFRMPISARRVGAKAISEVSTPFIQLLPGSSPGSNDGHYRILRWITPEVGLQVIDPPRPSHVLQLDELQAHSNDVLILLLPKQGHFGNVYLWLASAMVLLAAVLFVGRKLLNRNRS